MNDVHPMAEVPPFSLKRLLSQIFRFLASFGLGVVVLSFMLLLTWLGTLEQTEKSLYSVQQKYFNSLFLTHEIGPLKIPLPGVYLLLAILFVNILCGGIIRIRKNWRNFGVVISHFSILLLIAAGAVEYYQKIDGHLRLYEGEKSAIFTSYHSRVIEVMEVGEGVTSPVSLIRQKQWEGATQDKPVTFRRNDWPFSITIDTAYQNCEGYSADMETVGGAEVVDGYFLRPMPAAKNAEADLAGVYATIKPKEGNETKRVVLWDFATAPVTYRTRDGKTYLLQLKRESWEMPFAVTLNKFKHEFYPGTRKPKLFESEVTQHEATGDSARKIEMNKPLRSQGYTLFQASWGPEDARPGEKLYSVFAVVKNPSDQWPVYACILSGIGLFIHFAMRLMMWLTRLKKQAPAPTATQSLAV